MPATWSAAADARPLFAEGGDDPFVRRDSAVELSFGVKEDGSISLGAEGELVGQITHTLRLTLGPPPVGT